MSSIPAWYVSKDGTMPHARLARRAAALCGFAPQHGWRAEEHVGSPAFRKCPRCADRMSGKLKNGLPKSTCPACGTRTDTRSGMNHWWYWHCLACGKRWEWKGTIP